MDIIEAGSADAKCALMTFHRGADVKSLILSFYNHPKVTR
jgi:hypothetical protein